MKESAGAGAGASAGTGIYGYGFIQKSSLDFRFYNGHRVDDLLFSCNEFSFEFVGVSLGTIENQYAATQH